MNMANNRVTMTYPLAETVRVRDLAVLTARQTDLADWPQAADVQKNVLIYDCTALSPMLSDPAQHRALMAEWSEAMRNGPGVVVLKHAEPDLSMIDAATAMFYALIDAQNRAGSGGGDHFAKPGANDRIWNSLEKHCLADPANFARYYGNPFLAAISEAWLGPHSQMTAQLNVVNPGGAAQSPHRDYHLGFQSRADIERYPLHVQVFSPFLTLQGAIAHVDATLESGPTQLLPYSQLWDVGYLGMGLPEVRDHFVAHQVQVPLEKGDMLFFSPALLHAAGTNKTKDVRRMVNLFQVSSAYGRAMETVDRARLVRALYPVLRAGQKDGSLTAEQITCALAASAEGYSFPTNLDRDPPLGGLAPKTQKQLVVEALEHDWEPEDLGRALDLQAEKKRS